MMQVVLICLLALLSYNQAALYMDLYPGDLRCVGEELDQLETATFAMSASSKVKDNKQRITAKIRDPDEEDLFFDKLAINNKVKEFTHKLSQRGLYEMCFELHDGKTPVRVFFHVNYKPLNADGSDSSRVVNKEEVPTLQQDLQLIERKLKDISIEIEHAKRQETYLNTATETTQSRLEWFSLMSIVILLTMSAWQIFYLRSFFTAKKLL